ncbi:hypothetical protein DC915_RS03030 [Vibrio parahaemolyticus]|uniref:Uncharacterized protein n=1 Tax=Vibrio jasicida TaxID=766224 RepID=A0AAU9QWH3_9VIBR|nr:hypothetical protein [Vibrio parahaemolyticus]EJG0009953.1 hypothetical protein [Vibrio parahaemolyticus]ELA8176786.1 hypothetical protein [Vibrio alginolyticus]CAH1599009.1 hypothetical protein THF1C08_50342 [Vibrio jasicida]CAH1601360.1 hypothetical protein THF1A12_50003 [Vibrio jasicida]
MNTQLNNFKKPTLYVVRIIQNWSLAFSGKQNAMDLMLNGMKENVVGKQFASLTSLQETVSEVTPNHDAEFISIGDYQHHHVMNDGQFAFICFAIVNPNPNILFLQSTKEGLTVEHIEKSNGKLSIDFESHEELHIDMAKTVAKPGSGFMSKDAILSEIDTLCASSLIVESEYSHVVLSESEHVNRTVLGEHSHSFNIYKNQSFYGYHYEVDFEGSNLVTDVAIWLMRSRFKLTDTEDRTLFNDTYYPGVLRFQDKPRSQFAFTSTNHLARVRDVLTFFHC